MFTTVKENPITSVKNQNRAGTCWCYSSYSFLESELLRMGKGEYDLSEMFTVYNTYLDRAAAGRNTAFWAGIRCPRKKSEIWVYHNPAICGIIPWSITTKEERPMRCPYCGYRESKVVDSRPADEGASIRRRRECLSCEKRFTTYETIEYLPMVVIKKDGSRQSFDRSKVLRGIQRSCEKRPVSVAEMERMVTEIEQELQNSLEREISTGTIGEKVMEKLKKADEVAYVRFASVYRQFKDINTFMSELNKLLSEK